MWIEVLKAKYSKGGASEFIPSVARLGQIIAMHNPRPVHESIIADESHNGAQKGAKVWHKITWNY